MRTVLLSVVVLLVGVTSAGCEVIGDIFQAGMATGIIVVVLVLALIGFLVSRLRR